MPIYEYKCENGHVFDIMQKMSEDPLSSCIECGAPVRKILQPVSIAFKGSGFYSTDYSKKSTKTEPSKNGDSDSKSASAEKKSGNSSDKKTTDSSSTTSSASDKKATKK
ncbi:MAG: FmdB family zinc ribbon protein [Rubrobacteraceae bacterium]